MTDDTETLGVMLARRGFGRRSLLKFAIAMTSSLALPPAIAPVMAANLAKARRRSVIWLSFQECTGCLETLLRSSTPTIDSLIFDFISLDYQEALMAAAGADAERTLREAVAANKGEYLLAIDGSIPTKDGGVYSLTAGRSNVSMLADIAADAKAILAIGTCAAYGGIPKAYPNPTGAVGVEDLVSGKPIVNIPGCPPVPEVLSGVMVHFISFGRLPDLDDRKRPLAYFGTTIHDQCYRRPFYDQGKFAKSFDDEGARQGWCLFELGCKGPVTPQRLRQPEVERGHQLSHRIRAWLHRLLRTRFLGQGRLLHLARRRKCDGMAECRHRRRRRDCGRRRRGVECPAQDLPEKSDKPS